MSKSSTQKVASSNQPIVGIDDELFMFADELMAESKAIDDMMSMFDLEIDITSIENGNNK